MVDLDRKAQPTDVIAEDTWRLREECEWRGLGGCMSSVSLVLLTGESLNNEGTGFDGRSDGSFERQD